MEENAGNGVEQPEAAQDQLQDSPSTSTQDSSQTNQPVTDQGAEQTPTPEPVLHVDGNQPAPEQTVVTDTYGMTQTQYVVLPNGSTLEFHNSMTLGDALIASGIFLLVGFLVIKFLLQSAYGGRR